MNKPLVDRIPFVKIVVLLTIGFGVSMGLCGFNLVLSLNNKGRSAPMQQLLASAVNVEFAGIILCGLGLVVTVIAWVVLSLVSRFSPKDP